MERAVGARSPTATEPHQTSPIADSSALAGGPAIHIILLIVIIAPYLSSIVDVLQGHGIILLFE